MLNPSSCHTYCISLILALATGSPLAFRTVPSTTAAGPWAVILIGMAAAAVMGLFTRSLRPETVICLPQIVPSGSWVP